MADDKAKKTKIDLKARLGKTTQMGIGAPGAVPLPPPPSSDGGAPQAPSSDPGSGPGPGPGSAPRASTAPPVSSVRPPPGISMGIAPPPGISPGIPLPPFGQPQRQAPRAEPKPTAAQQTIKVDVGEEIHEERKKSRTRAMLAALAGAVVGLGIGFVAGGSQATGERTKSAARGAGALEKDVKLAGDKLGELETKLNEAADKLKAKSFPDDLATSLAGLTIPFESTNLDGKGVGGLPPRVLKMVLNYTSAVEQLNKSRETLRNLVGIAKEPIVKAWKEEAAPVANFSVIFRTEGGKTVVGELVPNKEPFNWKGDYPASYKVVKQEGGKPADKSANRWQKGELPGNDLTAVPIDPKSVAGFSSDVVIGRLSKAIYDMRTELHGNEDNPSNPIPGLVKMSGDLAQELHKASLNQ
jgi:hypothetical protein